MKGGMMARPGFAGAMSGFSLLEILVALVVLGLAGSLIARGTGLGARSMEKAWERIAADRVARSTLDRLGLDLRPTSLPVKVMEGTAPFQVEIRERNTVPPHPRLIPAEIVVLRDGRMAASLDVLLDRENGP